MMTTQSVVKPTTSTPPSSLLPQHSDDRSSKKRKFKWLRLRKSKATEAKAPNPWQAKIAFWLARSINPPVRPQQDFQVDLTTLRQLPNATLGRELANFWDCHNFQPIQTGDWLQKTHDIWHVVTGLSPSVEDEFILQAFVRAQVFRPSSAIVVLVGLMTGRLSWASLQRSLHLGRVANNIVQWDIESDWETPLGDVREKLGLHRQGIKRQTKGFQGH